VSVALILSGGGARGAFEVGAALFLYDIYAIRPDIICATSVGAINGAKLAEGGTPDEKRMALEELKSIWLELKRYSDMWEEAEWLVELGGLQVGDDTIRDLILPGVTGQPSMSARGETPFLRDNFPWLLDIRALLGGVYQLIATVPPIKEKADQGKLRSILRLRPIEHKMRGIVETGGTRTTVPPRLDSDKVRRSGVKLRLAMVSLETGALRYATEDGRLLERDNATPVLASTTTEQPDPACEEQAAEVERLQTIIERQYEDPPLPAQVVAQINAAKAALPKALQAPLLPYRPGDKFSAVHWIRLLKWLTKAVIGHFII
jgi:NTE family protein